MTLTVSVDPGMVGAIAVFEWQYLADVFDMPTTTELVGKKHRKRLDAPAFHRILNGLFMQNQWSDDDPHVVMEKPQPRHTDSATGAFASGMAWGQMLTIANTLGAVVTIVRPQTWTLALGVGSDKADHVAKAEELWPGTWFRGPRGGALDGRADAALIGWHQLTCVVDEVAS